MRRPFLQIAGPVLAFSVLTELLCIQLVRGPVLQWLERPHRAVLFASFVVVNLVNALFAGWLATRVKETEALWKESEHRRHEVSGYLNHNIRNALSAIQFAAYITKDPKTIKICDQATARIVNSLKAAEQGLPSEVRPKTVRAGS